METLFSSFIIAWFVTFFVLRYESFHAHLTRDADTGVQKLHSKPTPRVGGMAVFLGVFSAIGLAAIQNADLKTNLGLLLLSALPAFLGGVVEDLTKKVTPLVRLVLAFMSAALAFFLLDARLDRVDIWGIDWLLANSLLLTFLLTMVAVGGVSHAVNIIDGFNGLMSGYAVLAFSAFAAVAWWLDDEFLFLVSMASAGGILGFMYFNFPKGRIFMGDGGAYLIGFMLAEVAVMMVVRHGVVSAWFVMAVLALPVFETVFSIYRRAFVQKTKIGMPDALHLHTLIYRRITKRWQLPDKVYNNSATAPYLWVLSLVSIVPAIFLWHNTLALLVVILIFIYAYIWLYRRIVRFERAPFRCLTWQGKKLCRLK
jgi:UDP-N-acetylmuramyl pentapeptide phosphotransferase/UDP-N-acetylglucosamine-1-phosphate transferase